MARPYRKTVRPTRPAGPWKFGPVPVVGVVGGIGAGKSLVASLLQENGAFVLDADKVGHALLDQSPCRELVVERFGPGVLTPVEGDAAPAVDRRSLGALVFSEPAALRALEAILHPRMKATFEKAIARTVRRGQAKAVVLDAAVLYEAGWDALCDRVLFVESPPEARHSRLRDGRGWTDEAIAAREAAQQSLLGKRHRADFDVANHAGPEALRLEVARVWKALLASAPPRPARAPRLERDAADRGPRR